MKSQLLSLLLVIALIALATAAEKPRKLKKVRRIHHKKPAVVEETQPLLPVQTSLDDEIKMMENDEKFEKQNEDLPEFAQPEEVPDEYLEIQRRQDLCAKVKCGAGRICQVDENDEPQCVCIPECPVETEARRKVCSNHNETWTSDCAVYQQRCWCDKGDDRCKGEDYKHVHIDYYGECREMPECTESEMSDFPRRMRDWLFNIMRDLADRQELNDHYLKLEREAETNMTKRWSNAAVWKWCDLDGHPHDRAVSRHELFPIRAPLMSLEHCISPFLTGCDANDDHKITLDEWAACLELNADEIEDRCEEIEENLDVPM